MRKEGMQTIEISYYHILNYLFIFYLYFLVYYFAYKTAFIAFIILYLECSHINLISIYTPPSGR